MFISNHLSSKQMKEYIDLFADINELFIRLITLGEIILKELRNCILRTILVRSLFYSIWVYTSLYFLFILLGNQFFCLAALFVFTASSYLDQLFINFCNICIIIIYIVGLGCFIQQILACHFSIKQPVRTDTS